MKQQQLDSFLNCYCARVEYVQPRRTAWSNPYEEYEHRPGTVELELPIESLEFLVALDLAYNEALAEAEIRKRSPAVADAYSKYQMLLALHK